MDYTILIHLRSGKHSQLTLGPQFLFSFNKNHNLEYMVTNLVVVTNDKLESLFERYKQNLEEAIEIEFNFYHLERTENLPEINRKYLQKSLNLFSDYAQRSVKKINLILPNTMDITLYGN